MAIAETFYDQKIVAREQFGEKMGEMEKYRGDRLVSG